MVASASRGNPGDDLFAGDGEVLYHWANGSPGWDSLGPVPQSTTSSNVAAASWGPGRLDLFVNGTDGRIYHRAYAGPAGYSAGYNAADWEPGWDDILLDPCSFNTQCRLLGSPTATSWTTGHIDLVVRTSIGEYQRIYNAGDSRVYLGAQGWSPWIPLQDPPPGSHTSTSPSLTGSSSGHLELFQTGSDGNVYRRTYDGTGWFDSIAGETSRWTAWQAIGTPAGFQQSAVATSWGSGAANVLVFADNAADGSNHYRSVGTVDSGWWYHLTPAIPGGPVGDPAVSTWTYNGAGEVAVFQLAGDGNLYQRLYGRCPPPQYIDANLVCHNP